MENRYYACLAIGLCLSSLPAVSIYLSGDVKKSTNDRLETVYHFKNVDHPIQPIPQKIDIDKQWLLLGKALFNSTLLSKDNTISCASCHVTSTGGDDGFPVSVGVNNKVGVRNSPTVLNATFNFRQFWDGRANSLLEQASGPIHNPVEMASSWPAVITKLSKDSYFYQAFNDLSPDGITVENILLAIVTYEESLITPNAPIDQYLLGNRTALTQQQIRGLQLFIDYGCSTCHQGTNIGGNIYQKLGRINDIPKKLTQDFGKYEVTKKQVDRFVFKVPSLRNIAQTAPYFHNGSVSTLNEAVTIMASSQLGRQLSTKEVEDIVALLHSFSSKEIELE